MTSVEFHFDFGSPNAYLAHRVGDRIFFGKDRLRDVEEAILASL
jgi:2-hydroxychromene-2-carboxylate isomerase